MCTVLESISEPSTDRLNPPANASTDPSPTCALQGYADLHVHMFAEMAHGGAVLAGKAYAPDPDPYGKSGINQALEQDFTTLASLVDTDGDAVPAPVLCPGYVDVIDPNNGCQETFFHGDHDALVGDPIGSFLGTQDGAQSNLGAPVFNGWPRWSSTTHQQMYYKWLERAWQGGLRLITMLAVTNEALCRGSRHEAGTNCLDSMQPIDAQIAETKRFESFIDEQFGADADDQGWFRIVYTPAQARQVIAEGKLAVVLGIEVAELFNCKFPISQCDGSDGFISDCNFSEETNGRKPENEDVEACTPDYIRDKVQEYYDLGVRHVFPIHNFDNAFGAAATWQDGIEVGNRVVEDHWWRTENCFHDGYGFALGSFTQALLALLKFDDEIGDIPTRFPIAHADCNELGLFPLGRVLIEELMAKGMLIDVDHVSNRAFDDILDMAEERDPPYPVVATHVLSFDLHEQDVRHERHRTRAQLERIRDVGGMIAAMLKDEVQDTGRKGERQTVDYAPAEVRDDCRYSSKTFAQAYAYAVDVMEAPVAMGSDFNGVAGHFGPRFGNEACGGDLTEQSQQYAAGNRLEYPFRLGGFGTFDKQVTGDKVFDYNVDGMAHIGLLPDFVADLETVGMAQSDLSMMFRSAEHYVRVWERALGVEPAADAPACRQCGGISIGPDPFYSDTTLFFSPSGGATAGETTVAWDFGDGASTTGTLVTHRYTVPGPYTVKVTVSDQIGSSECTKEITVLDSNDTLLGAQIAIDAPDETLEGTTVPVRFRHSTLFTFEDASCGATGVRSDLEQTNLIPPEFSMNCFYPGGLERDADISVTAKPILEPAVTRTHTIRILNRPPEIVAAPVPPVPWGQGLVHSIDLDDVVGESLRLEVNWGDSLLTETFHNLAPGPFELRHTYAAPSRFGSPYRIVLELFDDVDMAIRILEVEVVGIPPEVALDGPIRSSVGAFGRFEFSATDADGGRAQLGSVSCGPASEEALAAIIRDIPPDPIGFVARCDFISASASNPVVVTMIDDEQNTASKALEVVVGVPPTGEVLVHSAPPIVPPGTPVRFLANGFATEGDPITVESVTCNGEEVPNPIILTFAGEQKFVDFTCTAPELGAASGAAALQGALETTLVAAVQFSDFDGAATFQTEVGVGDATPTATASATSTGTLPTSTATPTGTLPTATATTTLVASPTVGTPQPIGATCASPGECSSGFCTDGVCCDVACDDPLRRCDLPAAPGVCSVVATPVPVFSWTGACAVVVLLLGVAWRAVRRTRRR
jgi:microsomal dipeptidase-like Zn-dependent dipeptidase/PKD repeat protein